MDNEFLLDPTMIQEFLTESEELLQGMDQDMVTLESTPNDADLLNRIFRALHTIKGTAGFLGFEPVVRLSHQAEDVLNNLRKGALTLSQRMMDALLASRDQLGVMLQDIRGGGLKQYSIEGLVGELKVVGQGEAPARALELPTAPTGEATSELQNFTELDPIHVETAPMAATETPTLLDVVPGNKSKSANEVSQTMRVDVRKLDDLINLVGELVLERNRLMKISRDFTLKRLSREDLDSALNQSTARLSFVTEELQSAGLRTRMVPIDTVFKKFPRLVRDVSRTVQKEVDLVMRGEDTEIDKTMVELIGDPLIHLVRNSLDHGLERPDVRVAAGKPRVGTIRLEAEQAGDQILISVIDDGGGIDPERVGRKAVEKGLVSAERLRTLNQREILDFIFLPGFSTVEIVNDLSGRGVGMDVVRTNLRKMNGTIDLDSRLGEGTTVTLRLPLTLAILPVLLVEVAGEIYALPLRSVIETARVQASELHRVEGIEVLRLRGETLPLLRLGRMFSSTVANGKGSEDKVVVLGIGDRRIALLVDQLIGQESTVIKPLSSYLQHSASLAGATISGDGRVRLVLDPAGLLASACEASTYLKQEVVQ